MRIEEDARGNMCSEKDCQAQAIGTEHCLTHGGGRKCTVEGCCHTAINVWGQLKEGDKGFEAAEKCAEHSGTKGGSLRGTELFHKPRDCPRCLRRYRLFIPSARQAKGEGNYGCCVDCPFKHYRVNLLDIHISRRYLCPDPYRALILPTLM